MGVEVDVVVDDIAFQEFMRAVLRRQRDLKPLLKRFQIVMTRSIALNFREEGRPKKWRKLRAATIAQRRRQSQAVMQDTGRLRMSALVRTAPGNITRFTANSLTMGSSLKQASWLQEGTQRHTITPVNAGVLVFRANQSTLVFARAVNQPGLPARPFIIIQDEDVVEMSLITAQYAAGEDLT